MFCSTCVLRYPRSRALQAHRCGRAVALAALRAVIERRSGLAPRTLAYPRGLEPSVTQFFVFRSTSVLRYPRSRAFQAHRCGRAVALAALRAVIGIAALRSQ